MNKIYIQIMWKEIAIILLFICLLRFLTDFYIVKKYKKLIKDFFAGEWERLEIKMIKHQKICNIFSDGPFNKKIRAFYNGLCVALASIGLVRGDEETFLRQLSYIKKPEEYEMKSFMLSLYYNSKKNEKEAIEQFHKYIESNPKSKNMQDVLEYLYEQKVVFPASSVKSFHNPAIIKLFVDNNIKVDDRGQEDDSQC